MEASRSSIYIYFFVRIKLNGMFWLIPFLTKNFFPTQLRKCIFTVCAVLPLFLNSLHINKNNCMSKKIFTHGSCSIIILSSVFVIAQNIINTKLTKGIYVLL
jgi:type III secretory pathway component EscT